MLEFLFQLDRPFFWPAAGLNPQTDILTDALEFTTFAE
jgi:hypothetical protein